MLGFGFFRVFPNPCQQMMDQVILVYHSLHLNLNINKFANVLILNRNQSAVYVKENHLNK